MQGAGAASMSGSWPIGVCGCAAALSAVVSGALELEQAAMANSVATASMRSVMM